MEVDSITNIMTARTNGDEDPYKSEGQITLKIEKLSEFAHEGPKSRRLSDPVYIRGLPWKILAIPKMEHGSESTQKWLGYYLECNADNKDPSWNCSGNVTLKLLSQKPGKEDYVREFSHVFNAKEDDWGYKQFMTFEDIMDPEKGWYDEKEDTIVLLVDVKADPPHVIKSLEGIKEKENEIEINNSVINLEELENLKKNKEESDKKLNEKLKENKEIYEKVAKNVNQITISCEEIIKLKEENNKFMKELDKNNFIIKQLESEKVKNLNEYDEEIEKIKNKVENLEKEKKSACDLSKIKENELKEEKKKVEELIILNKNLETKVSEVETEKAKLNEKLENQSKGLQQLKNIFGSMDGI
uniref:MATH domain-containing protein n=1 Tax=Meloidogyne enterolobii TaxID=390850 RepID=A0A6V7X3Y7_MELEN|nr:unnamed protein product [Meloidogyne enterolobii]